MNSHEIEKLDAKHEDLMSRAVSMRKSGYIASADHLLAQAYAVAQRRHNMIERDLNEQGLYRTSSHRTGQQGAHHA